MDPTALPADDLPPLAEAGLQSLWSNGCVNRNYRAHLQSAAYLGLALVTILAGWAGPTGLPWWEDLGLAPAVWWHLLPLAAMSGALLIKLRHPTLALIWGALCVAADLSFGINIGLLICLTDLIYNHGIRAPAGRTRAVNMMFVGMVAAVTLAVAVVDTGQSVISVLLLGTAVLLVPCWWSAEVRRGYPAFVEDQVRQRIEQERHAELLAQQERRRAYAVEAERRRMAHELHDVVSAQVSAVALTSGAVLNSEADSGRDREALQTIRVTSLAALEDLRQMVQMLRTASNGGDDSTAELLTKTTWDQVLEQARKQGLGVTVDGAPQESLPTAVQSVLLRILQESLSNAHRHGHGTADVRLQSKPGQIELQVASPLPPQPVQPAGTGTGTGLAVMEERAKSVGGRLRAGEDSGQWAVQAELPTDRAAERRHRNEL